MVWTRVVVGGTVGASLWLTWKLSLKEPSVPDVQEIHARVPQLISSLSDRVRGSRTSPIRPLQEVLLRKVDIDSEWLEHTTLDELCDVTFRNIEAAFKPWRDVSVPEIYTMFGAKTSYDDVRALKVDPVKIPGCRAVQVWILARHGTRYPGEAELQCLYNKVPRLRSKILQNAGLGRGRLSNDVLEDLKNWNIEIHPSHHNKLTPSGARESRELAERFKRRFPDLFQPDYHPSLYVFRHTDSSRTKESAEQFAVGLFGVNIALPLPVKADPVIKFYKSCKRWLDEVENNVSSRMHRDMFRKGPEMKKVLENCRERLGLNDLTIDDLLIIYSMCRFEHAFKNDKKSQSGHCTPWCKLFTKEEIEILEYDEDLEYYWTDGYGYDINYQQACPPVKDFLDRFRSAMSTEDNEPRGVFHFSHSGLLLKVYARLGLYKDAFPLTSQEFDSCKERLWRSSLIDPFNANLAMILFNCEGEYKVMTFAQEKPIILPGCPSELCPMTMILEKYGPVAENCNVQEICDGLEYKSKKVKTKFGTTFSRGHL